MVKSTFINQVWTITVPNVATFRLCCKNGTNLTALNSLRKLAKSLAKGKVRTHILTIHIHTH